MEILLLLLFFNVVLGTVTVEDAEECGTFCGIDGPVCNSTTSTCATVENSYYDCNTGGEFSALKICTPLDINDWYDINDGKKCGVKHSVSVNRGTDTFSYNNLIQCKAFCKITPECIGLYYEDSSKRCYYLDDVSDMSDSTNTNDKCMLLLQDSSLPPTPIPTPAPTSRVYSNAGSAYIFKLDESGSWVQLALIEPNTLIDDQNFGYDLGINDNEVTIGNRVFQVQNSEVVQLFSVPTNGTLLASYGNRSVFVNDTEVEVFEGDTLINTLNVISGNIEVVTFSGIHLFIVINGNLYHADLEDQTPQMTQTSISDMSSSIMVTDNEHLIIARDGDIEIRTIELNTINTIYDINDVLTMSLNGTLLTVYNSDGDPTVYNIMNSYTDSPSLSPTSVPTVSPSTSAPTNNSTTVPTMSPTTTPTMTPAPTTPNPTTSNPTSPTTESPTQITLDNELLLILTIFAGIIGSVMVINMLCCRKKENDYVVVLY